MSEPAIPVAHRDSPYFGLEYYDEKFGPWFFGREAEGSKIITNLRAARLTLLHAESGVGKSSLLRAGVAWRMRRLADDMLARRGIVRSVPVVFSSWKDDPSPELADCIIKAVQPYLRGRPVPELPGGRLNAAIEAASEAVNASLLIILDQFEEYFLYRSREPVPDRFADELARCINRTDLRANFLIAVREDAYAGLGDLFKGRIANVYGNYLHIDYLDRGSAEKAIREPLAVYNSQAGVSQPVKVRDELVEAVLDEVRAFGADGDVRPSRAAAYGGGGDRIATPLLQLVMERVWDAERAEGSHELRLSTLQKLRGVRMIVDAHLGKALDSLGGAERKTAIDMFDHLVTPSGGKIAESVSDLAKRTGCREDEVGSVLTKLDRERIVRPVPAAPGQDPIRGRRYEIFHDVLGPTINRTIAVREEKRRSRRFRLLAALAVFLLLIVSGLAALFAYLLHSADEQKQLAQSRQLTAEAVLNGDNPELSSLLALQALHLHPTSLAEDALRSALENLQILKTLPDGSRVSSAEFDPVDTAKVASADDSGTVRIWDVKSGKSLVRMGEYPDAGGATAVAFNPYGTELAAGYGDGTVAVFDARTGSKLQSGSVGTVVNHIEFIRSTGELAIASNSGVALWEVQKRSKCCHIIFNDDQAFTVAADPRNPQEFAVALSSGVVLLNTSGPGQPRPQGLVAKSASDAEFSPDGRQVVTAEQDGDVEIYRLAARKVVATLSAGAPNAMTAAFSPDGTQVVAGYGIGPARVWDLSTKVPLTLLAGNTEEVNAARFSADGSEVVTANGDGNVRVWYARPRELRKELTSSSLSGMAGAVSGAEYIGNRIIIWDNEGNLGVFTPDGKRQTVISTGLAVDFSWAFNRAGTEIVTSGTDVNGTGIVQLWHAAGTAYRLTVPPSPIKFSQSAAPVFMSPDGSRIAIVTGDGTTVQVRSADTGRLLRTLHAKKQPVALAFSPDAHQVVGADINGQVEVWNGSATTPKVLGKPGQPSDDVSFNQSGSEFLTTSESAVNVWDARDDRLLNSVDPGPALSASAFSGDDSKIVAGCVDGTVRVLDAHTGRTLVVLQASNGDFVTDLSFSPDGKSIVAFIETEDSGFVQVWSSELATASLPALERIARQRVTEKLTPAQQQQYLTGS